MLPVKITRSRQTEAYRKDFTLVSTSFIATFVDGTEKVLNRKDWTPNILLGAVPMGVFVLGRDDSPLYYLNWQACPLLGDFHKNYPKK